MSAVVQTEIGGLEVHRLAEICRIRLRLCDCATIPFIR